MAWFLYKNQNNSFFPERIVYWLRYSTYRCCIVIYSNTSYTHVAVTQYQIVSLHTDQVVNIFVAR